MAQAAKSDTNDLDPQGAGTPPEGIDPHAEAPEPPALSKAVAVQEMLGADSSSSASRQRALHAAEVQPAKPKMKIPTFRRRTPVLLVSTSQPGPTHSEGPTHTEGLGKPLNSEALSDVAEACDDAAEDMILDEPERGESHHG